MNNPPPYPGPPGPPHYRPPNMMPSFSSFPIPGAPPPPMHMHMQPPPFMTRGPMPMAPMPNLRMGMAPGPGMPAGAGFKKAAHPNQPAEKSTMVSVGKIATTIDNKVMQTLLEACGPVKSWKRAEDPDTKVLKGFGFCEFEDAEGVLRAIRLLNGLKIDGQELVIKGNSATQRYVEEYEAKKLADRQAATQAKVEAAKKKQEEEGEVVDEAALQKEAAAGLSTEDQDKDNKALEVTMGIVSEREAEATKNSNSRAAANAAEFLQQMERGDLQPDSAGGGADNKSSGKDRDRSRERDRSSRDPERDRDRERERERDRERDMERERRRELEREYEMRLRDWERQEIIRGEARKDEVRRQEESEKERYRRCRQDLKDSDSDDEVEPWRRRPYRSSRRCMERRKARAVEEEWDDLDRQREQREMEKAEERRRRRAAKGDHGDGLYDDADMDDRTSDAYGRPLAGSRYSQPGLRAIKEDESQLKQEVSEASAPGPHVDDADPIYKAMMAAAATSKPRSDVGTGLRHGFGSTSALKQEGHAKEEERKYTYGSGSAGRGVNSFVTAGALDAQRAAGYHRYAHDVDPHAAIKSEHRNVLRSESPPPAGAAPPAAPHASAAAPPTGSSVGGGGVQFGGGRQKTKVLANVFGEDEEEKSTKRILKPIQYSEDEKRVAEEIERDRAAGNPQPQTSAAAVDPKVALKTLMDKIPTTKDGVWAYPIKWNHYNEATRQRFSQWVDAKVSQLLGAPEPSVVAFVLDLIHKAKTPSETAQELEPLLEADTETFVLRLYRTVIFETERAAAGL